MKYFIVDLDQTLLNDSRAVSEYSLKGINKIKSLGFKVVINTARSFRTCFNYMEQLKPDYTILNGGSIILDNEFKPIYSTYVSLETTEEIIRFMKEDSDTVDFSIQCDDYLYSENLEYVSKNSSFAMYFNFNKPFNKKSCKILVNTLNKRKYQDLAEAYNLDFTNYLDGPWCRLCASTKALGNKLLFRILNDDNPMDYTFGDDLGDLEMLEDAYHGVIMINANNNYKKNLNVTDYDNNNDGVVHYMEEKILNEH